MIELGYGLLHRETHTHTSTHSVLAVHIPCSRFRGRGLSFLLRHEVFILRPRGYRNDRHDIKSNYFWQKPSRGQLIESLYPNKEPRYTSTVIKRRYRVIHGISYLATSRTYCAVENSTVVRYGSLKQTTYHLSNTRSDPLCLSPKPRSDAKQSRPHLDA